MTTVSIAAGLTCRLEMLPGECVADQLAAAKRFGFDGVTLPGRFINRWLEPIREYVADGPLPIVAISLGFDYSLLSPTERERRKCRDSLLRMFDLCAEFGAKLFNMPPCLIQDNPTPINDPVKSNCARDRCDGLLLRQLPSIGDEAQQRGVELVIEPVNQYESHYLNSIEHAADICRKLNHPAIGFTADFFHMQMEELHTDEAIRTAGVRRAGGRIPLRHVHVAENCRVEPGPGSLDFCSAFRALKEIGYDGWIEVECRRLSGPAIEVFPKSVEYLRNAWGRA